MDKIEIIVYSLPIMFMLHDFEEIIGLKTWFDKNGEWLDEKFPMLTKHLQSLRHLSVQAFVVAVWEEYLIISIVTLTALTFQWYDAWIIIFMAYSFHIIIHIIQWIIVRRYIPMLITSLLSIPYIIWGINNIVCSFTAIKIGGYLIAGIFIGVLNLLFAYKLAYKFDKYMNNKL